MDSGTGGGVAAMVTPMEIGVEGVVFVLVEVEVVGGTSGLGAEVMWLMLVILATSEEGRTQKTNMDKAKVIMSS